jgi:uncharacterized membrane protein (DUF485 family)
MNPEKIKNIFSAAVSLLYVVVGIFAIWKKQFVGTPISDNMAYSVGVLMIAYGCFRIYRAWTNQ